MGRKGASKPSAATKAAAAETGPESARVHPDRRRWIYGGLDIAFGVMQAILIWKVIPNRLPSASFHLWTLPGATLVMGVGTLMGGRRGWKIALAGGSLALLSTILLIARIIVSAAFLSGVYGAFGKAAAMTALISVALLVELVALLPIVQVKYLMTRAGRRAFSVPAR
ncbi:MAG: hypothetical protein SFX73_00195 [Kofleriaceae bacterium]|nr:hypothetical protein [Kofleriaceae bacterium]